MFFAYTTWLERYMLNAADMNAPRDHYISTTFLAISVFLMAFHAGNHCQSKWYKFICFAGSKLSLNIYLLHPILIALFRKLLTLLAIHGTAKIIIDCLFPLIILVSATLVSWGLYEFFRKFKVFSPHAE